MPLLKNTKLTPARLIFIIILLFIGMIFWLHDQSMKRPQVIHANQNLTHPIHVQYWNDTNRAASASDEYIFFVSYSDDKLLYTTGVGKKIYETPVNGITHLFAYRDSVYFLTDRATIGCYNASEEKIVFEDTFKPEKERSSVIGSLENRLIGADKTGVYILSSNLSGTVPCNDDVVIYRYSYESQKLQPLLQFMSTKYCVYAMIDGHTIYYDLQDMHDNESGFYSYDMDTHLTHRLSSRYPLSYNIMHIRYYRWEDYILFVSADAKDKSGLDGYKPVKYLTLVKVDGSDEIIYPIKLGGYDNYYTLAGDNLYYYDANDASWKCFNLRTQAHSLLSSTLDIGNSFTFQNHFALIRRESTPYVPTIYIFQ